MRNSILLFVLVLLAACATPTANSGVDDLADLGTAQFQEGFLVLQVPSDGPIADATFVSLSKGSPSGTSRSLADTLVLAETQDIHIVVGGPNSTKTRVVVTGALDLLEGKDLEHLHLMFVGNADDADTVRQAVSNLGGHFYTPGE